MRAGLVIYGALDTLSGGYLYDRKLVAHLRACGDEVELISLPWRNYAAHLGDNLSRPLAQKLRALRIDILLQDELNHPSLFWLNQRLRRDMHFPVLSIAHHLRSSEQHPRWARGVYRGVERAYLRSVDGFIYNSETTRAVVESLAGQAKPGVVAVPGGDALAPSISDAAIHARAAQAGGLRLLFVGNLIARKGLHVVLDALALLRGNWTLDVVGRADADPAYAARVQCQTQRLGLAGRVRFMGRVSDTDLAALYRASHALVVPSSYEGYGIVYLEAMGFGLPAVGTRSGAAGEVITDGVSGWLVQAGDARALAERLSVWVQNPARLAEMGVAARRRSVAQPTWDESMARARAFMLERVKNWRAA